MRRRGRLRLFDDVTDGAPDAEDDGYGIETSATSFAGTGPGLSNEAKGAAVTKELALTYVHTHVLLRLQRVHLGQVRVLYPRLRAPAALAADLDPVVRLVSTGTGLVLLADWRRRRRVGTCSASARGTGSRRGMWTLMSSCRVSDRTPAPSSRPCPRC